MGVSGRRERSQAARAGQDVVQSFGAPSALRQGRHLGDQMLRGAHQAVAQHSFARLRRRRLLLGEQLQIVPDATAKAHRLTVVQRARQVEKVARPIFESSR